MATEVPLRCRCGRVRGVATEVAPETVNRVVCYCDDCQAYAAYLGQPGITDAAGGTDICQMAPARVQITEGGEQVQCVRLTEKGMYRWFAACCRTPIGNTVSGRVPFVGVVHAFIDHEADGRAVDSVLGKAVPVQGRFAIGGPPPGVHRVAPPRVVLRFAWLLFSWWITKKSSPSPFFQGEALAPRSAPHVLRPEEREALRRVGVALASQ